MARSARCGASAASAGRITSTPWPSATAVADGHATVLPLMPEFACPQQDPAATRADTSEDERKRDCERNAAKRWLAARGAWLQACRPVLPGDDLHCCQPVCEAAAAAGMDCIRVGKPGSRKGLYEVPESRQASGAARSTGWLPRRGKGKRSERHRFRRTAAAPLRQGRDALRGTWLEYAVERDGKRTCASSFFTGLAVTADNAERIARAGRARWKIENEGCNCLARHGRNCKRNFGHGKEGPANVPAVPNPFAFALHAVVQCVCALRQQCRRQPVTRRALFQELQVALRWFRFPDRPALLAAVRDGRAPPGCQAAGQPGPGLRAVSCRQRPAVKAGYRRSASGRGLGTPRTRDAGRATALPAVRRSRGAASGAQPLGQLIHLILRNNLHAPP